MRKSLWLTAMFVVLALGGSLPAAEAMPSEWPTVQGNFARTGFHGEIHGPGTGEVVWRFETGDLSIRGLPAVANHRVFFGGSDEYVYAVNATTGALEWRFRMPGPVDHSLVADQERVYVAGADDALYALDARDGEPQWTYRAEGVARGQPTANRNTVYIAAEHGTVHAVDSLTGARLWTYDIGQHDDRSTRPGQILPMEDKVIVSGPRGTVVALSAENGTRSWATDVDDLVVFPLARYDRLVLVPSSYGPVHALDPSNGTKVLEYSTTITDVTVTYDAGVLFVSGPQGVAAVDAQKSEILWQVKASHAGGRFIAVSDEALYVAEASGWVSAMDRATGQELWKHQIAMWIESSPVVVDGLLYVGTDQFRVFALDAGAGRPLLAPEDEPRAQLPGPSLAMVLLATAITAFSRRTQSCAHQEPAGDGAR